MSLPPGGRRTLWVLMALNVMAAAWMLAAGDRLDRYSAVTAVVTLGGHHLVVLGSAGFAFAILAVLAPMTAGFSVATGPQLAMLAIAGVASTVAFAGVLSVVVLVVGVALLVALVGRALL